MTPVHVHSYSYWPAITIAGWTSLVYTVGRLGIPTAWADIKGFYTYVKSLFNKATPTVTPTVNTVA